eukprot:TRINITY_DN4728_c0_g1_i1.p1 TRINITY_DN4728_c0_g1~~TRINITY_DN4728_c0_g1_i1.p1  ORF type:complete len:160 (+),score=46.74 TRINITY_DN4728_c0_g1_i1:46-480(+)
MEGEREANKTQNDPRKTNSDLLMFGLQDKVSPFEVTNKEKPTINKPQRSDILNKVAAFLPRMKESNDLLFAKLEANQLSPEEVNIEVVKEEQPFIAMNLGLLGSSESDPSEESGEEDNEEEPQILLPQSPTKKPKITELKSNSS